MMAINEDTELRMLPCEEFDNLAMILNAWTGAWKKLAFVAAKDLSEDSFYKMNGNFIRIIEDASRHARISAAAMFLDEWATMGRITRPTVGVLFQHLIEAELFRIADYVAIHILKVEESTRPEYGPAVTIDCEGNIIELLLEKKKNLDVPER